jgi:hypothetical protein
MHINDTIRNRRYKGIALNQKIFGPYRKGANQDFDYQYLLRANKRRMIDDRA